ncbi:MAG: TetR/AcrR family transcriptional regulator [Leptospiraceae bacterium]|nr:TetR/AcrR family transcriptional regulator [Leptospiraceae bacterium]MCP5511479.1 TetR/AcrR family transcriptional regulator [Leptospiraceae bacterium]
MKNFERARSEQSKEFRIQQILNASELIYSTTEFEKITYTQIAKEARFTRSNLYKYFRTKEDIFLHLLLSDLTKWIDRVESLFISHESFHHENFSRLWTSTLLDNERLLNLRSILFTHLEKNASEGSFLEFKNNSRLQIERLTEFLKKNLPVEEDKKISEFILLSLSMGSGIFPLYLHQEKGCKLLQKHGLPFNEINFSEVLNNGVRALSKVYFFS